MDPATIGISIIAALAGGAALGLYVMWRASLETIRHFQMDAHRYRCERDALLAAQAQRRADLAEWGRKGRQIQLEKRRAA